LFVGLVSWNAFNNTYQGALTAFEDAGPLLTKVYFPPECPPIAGAISVLYQTVIEMVVLFVVMALVQNFAWTTLLAPFALLASSLFGLGFGMMAGLWNVRYRDVAYISVIGLQLLFYGTPIIYPQSVVPDTAWGWLPIGDLVNLNPMTHFVNILRSLVYGLEMPSIRSVGYAFLWVVVAVVAGWATYSRRASRIIEEL
jgi:ABC-2 type transport system permease protein